MLRTQTEAVAYTGNVLSDVIAINTGCTTGILQYKGNQKDIMLKTQT